MRSHRLLWFASLLLIIALVVFIGSVIAVYPALASSVMATINHQQTMPQGSTNPPPALSPVPTITVKVYFSKFPDSLTDNAKVFAVGRTSPVATGLKTFALQQLVAGPTLTERTAGYFSEWNSLFVGPSQCNGKYPTGGPDFQVFDDMRGSKVEEGTVTVKFCRATASPGIGTDARVLSEITATVLQFSNVHGVTVLTVSGHCLGDTSGLDRCLK